MACSRNKLFILILKRILWVLIFICFVLLAVELLPNQSFKLINYKISFVATASDFSHNDYNKTIIFKELKQLVNVQLSNDSSNRTLRILLRTSKFPETRCDRIKRLIREGLLKFVELVGDEELRQLVAPLFTNKKLVIWTSDHHSSPVLDLRSLLEPLGVEFIDHTLYHQCDHFCHCDGSNGLRVLNSRNLLAMNPEIIAKFQKSYPIDDPEIARADAFATFYCFGHFELFLPYNKSLIAVSALRYETCRQPRRWSDLNSKLEQIHNESSNVIGANNRYDQEYIKYFTGLSIDYIPSFCLYTGTFYNPKRHSYLFVGQRNGLWGSFATLWNSKFQLHYRLQNASFEMKDLRYAYSHYDYTDLASHFGIVHIPYQISLMSIFEQYRMAIPLFFPSVDLFTQWNIKYRLAYDRTSAMLWGFSRGSDIPPHASQRFIPDPNNESDAQSQRHWLQLADFYTLPHISYFSSIEELVVTLHRMSPDRLHNISYSMLDFNRNQLKQVLQFWRQRLLLIAQRSTNRPS